MSPYTLFQEFSSNDVVMISVLLSSTNYLNISL